ncbi:MAG: hypothetical protein ACR2LI_07540 [Propionibacteriaceae bacterium]
MTGSVIVPGSVPPSRPGSAPTALRVAAVLLGVQGLVALGYGVVEISQAQSGRVMVGVGAGSVLLIYAAGLLLVGRGLGRARRWARGPAVATQLIHLPVAWSFRAAPTTWVAVLLAGFALAVLVAVLTPSSTAALVRTDPDGPPTDPDGKPADPDG